MNSGVEYKDNSVLIMGAYYKLLEQALLKICLSWQRNVTPYVPVITGKLRQSMHYRIDMAEQTVWLGSTLKDPPYSIYVELGTYKMAAQPYLRPSIMNYRKEYEKIVRDTFGGNWRIGF